MPISPGRKEVFAPRKEICRNLSCNPQTIGFRLRGHRSDGSETYSSIEVFTWSVMESNFFKDLSYLTPKNEIR